MFKAGENLMWGNAKVTYIGTARNGWPIVQTGDGAITKVRKDFLKRPSPKVLPDEDGSYKVCGGFGNWSIGWNQSVASIEIEFDRYASMGKIVLFDASKDDLKKLSIMFANLAE